MKVVVTGGFGGLGREIMPRLAERGVEGTPVSRRTGFDLLTGAGIEAGLAEADVVIHAAVHPLRHRGVNLGGTRRIVEVLQRRSRPVHLVYVSIVGCDRNPFSYYRAKHASEMVLRRSGLPVTVVRATQFHSLVAAVARALRLGPVALEPEGLSFQSVETAWVAERIVDHALAEQPVGYLRAPDLAGPERLTISEAIDLVRLLDDKSKPRLLTVPPIGASFRAFAAGANLPGPDAEIGGVPFRNWLAD